MKSIENIIVINLKRDKLRRQYMKENLCKNFKKNINIHFINAIDGNLLEKKGNLSMNHIACSMSHLKAWDYVIENNIEDFIILEDDVVFKDNFLKKTDEYLQNIPKDWSFIYFGYFGLANYDNKNYLIEKIIFSLPKLGLFEEKNEYLKYNNHFYIPEYPLGLHCYTINKNVIELFKSKAFYEINTVPDVQLATFFAYNKYKNVYCTRENLASQYTSKLKSNNFNFNLSSMLNKIIIYDSYTLSWRLSLYVFKIKNIPINGYTYIYLILVLFIVINIYLKVI